MYDPIFVHLQQEGHLYRSSFINGFKALKNANIDQNKGDFYSAFFLLSTGLERLMKFTLILNYMVNNKLEMPDLKHVKKFSHNLENLFEEVFTLSKSLSTDYNFELVLLPGSIERKLLVFLSDFAQKTRYFNLNWLSGEQSSSDPLERWSKLTLEIFKHDLPSHARYDIEQNADFISEKMAGQIIMFGNDLEKRDLSLRQAILQSTIFIEIAPHIIWHIMRIIYPIYKYMDDVCMEAQSLNQTLYPDKMVIPTMYEFLIGFISINKDEVFDDWD